jgi:hypothetical protein
VLGYELPVFAIADPLLGGDHRTNRVIPAFLSFEPNSSTPPSSAFAPNSMVLPLSDDRKSAQGTALRGFTFSKPCLRPTDPISYRIFLCRFLSGLPTEPDNDSGAVESGRGLERRDWFRQ